MKQAKMIIIGGGDLFAKITYAALLIAGLILTGCPVTTYSAWYPPRAEIELTGLSDSYQFPLWGYDKDGNQKYIGNGPIELPVTLKKVGFTLSIPPNPPIVAHYIVGHIASRWLPYPPPLGTLTSEGTRLFSVNAKYNDLHPSMQEIMNGAPYRGDPDLSHVYYPASETYSTTLEWDSFYEPPVFWSGSSDLQYENSNATTTYGTILSPGGHAISLSLKDAGNYAVDIPGAHDIVTMETVNAVFQLKQSGHLHYLGTKQNGDYIASPVTLETTHHVRGYFHWEVVSGPAQIYDPILDSWGTESTNLLLDYQYAYVSVCATNKSSLNGIHIRLKWAPHGPPIVNPAEAVEIITWKMTAFSPKIIPEPNTPPGPLNDFPTYYPPGYMSVYAYRTVYEQDSSIMFPYLFVNESRGTRYDIEPNNWPDIDMNDAQSDLSGQFFDILSYYGWPWQLYPEPLAPGCATDPIVLIYLNHIWRASVYTGYGYPLESPKVLYYYQCKGRR